MEHPAFVHFVRQLASDAASEFRKVLGLVSASLPVDAIFADVGSDPQSVAGMSLEDAALGELAKKTYATLVAAGSSSDEVLLMMSSAEPFKAKWPVLRDQFGVTDMTTAGDG